ncbi:MAG: N-acetyltransferase family protein [Chloroflexota bacterium]
MNDTLSTLHDGSPVVIRNIMPSDAAAHRRLIERISSTSRYERFLHAVDRLSDIETQHFVEVDGVARVALVALDPANPDEIIAVARFDREADPFRAEVAVLVGDAWQGRGLGTLLVQQLVERARTDGVSTLVANILATNTRSLSLFHDLGLPEQRRTRNGMIELKLSLDRSSAEADSPP